MGVSFQLGGATCGRRGSDTTTLEDAGNAWPEGEKEGKKEYTQVYTADWYIDMYKHTY